MEYISMQSVKWWKLVILLLMEVHRKTGLNAVLTVKPVDTNATVGSQIRLSCSTDAGNEVNWQYREDTVTDIYIANEGLVRLYRMTNRYKVDVNATTGQYDLVISNVTQTDGGLYICSEPEGWGIPSEARLTVTDGELPAKMCRENVVATKGGELQISFSSCSPEPYYLSHVSVGSSHSNDVYNLGKLLNNYADSGRFLVDIESEGLKLKITNVQMQDAGTFTCRGVSGHGERHNKELVVLDEMPTCTDNISVAECIATTTEITEVNCAVNYTGNCAPHSIWLYEYGNRSSSKVQQVFTCFNQTYSMVESKSIIKIQFGSQLFCHIDDTSQDTVQKFQCNTSVVPEQCKDHQQNGTSNDSTSDSSKTMLIALIIPLMLIVVFVAVVAWYMYIRRKRKSKAEVQISLCDDINDVLVDDINDVLVEPMMSRKPTEENEPTEGHSQCAKHLNGV